MNIASNLVPQGQIHFSGTRLQESGSIPEVPTNQTIETSLRVLAPKALAVMERGLEHLQDDDMEMGESCVKAGAKVLETLQAYYMLNAMQRPKGLPSHH